MSAQAVVMLVVSLVLVWGGLGLALWHLARHPDIE